MNCEYLRFYIALSPNEIEPVVRCAKKELPSAHLPKVGPHVSLIYSRDFDKIDRRKLKIELAPDVPTTIQFGSLALVLPKDNNWDDVENWIAVHHSAFDS